MNPRLVLIALVFVVATTVITVDAQRNCLIACTRELDPVCARHRNGRVRGFGNACALRTENCKSGGKWTLLRTKNC